MPQSPYTTLGIAARRSTRNPMGCRSHNGENSERKIAMPIASGVAIREPRLTDQVPVAARRRVSPAAHAGSDY
jgi:hypothetical protein